MSLKKVIREYFSYSASERKGLLLLVIILMIVLILPKVYSPKTEELTVANKNKRIDSLLTVLNKKDGKKEVVLFSFDPNTASLAILTRLGLTKFQINNIIKYRKNGGVFKSKSDFKKIYGIDDNDYNRLKEHINIPIALQAKKSNKAARKKAANDLFCFDPNTISKSKWKKLGVDDVIANRIRNYLSTGAKFKTVDDLGKIYGFDTVLLMILKPYVRIKGEDKDKREELIDLNLADAITLKSLPGIGETLSHRIVKYRKLLGGYSNKRQLLEVYGLSNETYLGIENLIYTSIESLRKISINKCDAKTLSKHPYINNRVSSDIVKYRERLGRFQSVQDLKAKHLLVDSVFQKVEAYLSI
ncbi:helix-hairpin-helix domain-containing protein [Marinifilum sp.]|uniref:helix-hairpin-helix domain-containing protein n=1 Tax=Marinifilum sp. TaxID=2033137 RepID=UPI003BAB5508